MNLINVIVFDFNKVKVKKIEIYYIKDILILLLFYVRKIIVKKCV